jgi:outer membrane receptor for monomeric catechols
MWKCVCASANAYSCKSYKHVNHIYELLARTTRCVTDSKRDFVQQLVHIITGAALFGSPVTAAKEAARRCGGICYDAAGKVASQGVDPGVNGNVGRKLNLAAGYTFTDAE